MDANTAYFEAQKLLVVVDGKPRSAAFIDQVLQNPESYEKYFLRDLREALSAAPRRDPAFAPYRSCVDAGEALARFAELRMLGRGQNPQSDAYRRPFWTALDACKAAVKAGEKKSAQ
jgi:hypothetical protein